MFYYTVSDYFDPVGQKELSVPCPDCHNNNCLELHFYQKRIETSYSKKISKKVSGILYCRYTQTEISPVLWTPEIENYFETEKRKLKLAPSSLKFSKWFYIMLFIPLVIIVSAIAYTQWESQQHMNQNKLIEQVQSGDKVSVMMSLIEKHQTRATGNTWLLVTNVEADTIWLKSHKDFNNQQDFDFDLSKDNFNGESLKASLSLFQKRTLAGFDYTDQRFSGYIMNIKKN